jgi:ATP citrate (pro-S)-lyase
LIQFHLNLVLVWWRIAEVSFVYISGREIPSVAGIINPGSEGFQKLFFGQEEIAIPVHSA